MGLFVVDEEKCKRDGVCVSECPGKLIKLNDQDPVPVPIEGAEALCIDCGHCVAVCPHGAMTHRSMSPEQCPPIKREWLPGREEVEHFLRARRSIRAYKDRPVERAVIGKLIDIARFAPSGHNVQPVRWLVVFQSDHVRRLAGLIVDWIRYLVERGDPLAETLHMDRIITEWERGEDRVCRAAPNIIVAHAPQNERTAQAACTIALSYLELAAPSFGLGACWAGYFNMAANGWPPLQEALSLPEGHISYGAMMVGYPKYRYHRLPLRNDALISWHRH